MKRILICIMMVIICLLCFYIGTQVIPSNSVEIVKPKATSQEVRVVETIQTEYQYIDNTDYITQGKLQAELDKIGEREYIISELEQLAADEGIPICYISDDIMQQEQEKYDFDFLPAGLCYEDKIMISILFSDDPTVLAHELAHHYAWTYEDDGTEERANEIAVKLLETGKYIK